MHVPTHYLARVAICQLRLPLPRTARACAWRRVGYLPLLFSFGVVDVVPELGVLDEEDEVELGGVLLGGVDALDDDSDVEGDAMLGVVDELDDVELLGGVDGVVEDDDVEGDGVTTGGVLLVVDDVSRLQPATPMATPAQSNATKALFISISRELKKVVPRVF